MEKLKELLNKYQEEKGSEIRFRRIVDNDFFEIGEDTGLGYETIFSKKYGFIKWLCDNKKIERPVIVSEGYRKGTYRFTSEPYTTGKSIMLENTVIMALSIDENPIELLIDCLK